MSQLGRTKKKNTYLACKLRELGNSKNLTKAFLLMSGNIQKTGYQKKTFFSPWKKIKACHDWPAMSMVLMQKQVWEGDILINWKKVRWKSCSQKCGGTRVNCNFLFGLEQISQNWGNISHSIFNRRVKGQISIDVDLNLANSGTGRALMESQNWTSWFIANGDSHWGMCAAPEVGKTESES